MSNAEITTTIPGVFRKGSDKIAGFICPTGKQKGIAFRGEKSRGRQSDSRIGERDVKWRRKEAWITTWRWGLSRSSG